MIKTSMKVYEDVDIGKYYKLTAFLKRQHVGYEAKKSLTFSRDQIDKFLQTAPDDTFLAIKVRVDLTCVNGIINFSTYLQLVAVVAIAGGCRCDELVKMELKDVEIKEDLLLIHLPYTKTHKKRSFTILNKGFGINPLDLYRKYINLRPKNGKSTRLFLGYRGGKCTVQPIGINSFGKMPAMIATFLKLENSKMYTGHAFRRSGTTLLADCGADVRTLKRFGGWKSDAVVDGYIEDSLQNKVNIAQQVLGLKSSSNTANQQFKVGCQKKELNLHDTPVSFNNNNCTINVNVYAHRT